LYFKENPEIGENGVQRDESGNVASNCKYYQTLVSYVLFIFKGFSFIYTICLNKAA